MVASLLRRHPRAVLAVALVLATGLGAAWYWASGWAPAQPADQGVDIGDADGAIDGWALRRAGARFAYVEASAGARRAATFEGNWQRLGEAGLQRGALHRWSLCSDAGMQMAAFVTTVARTDSQLSPAVAFDLDDPADCAVRPDPAALQASVRAFLAGIEHHLGRQAILRVTPAFERAYHLSAAIDRPLWGVRDFFPPNYLARDWRLWQANAARRVAGVDQRLHWDVRK